MRGVSVGQEPQRQAAVVGLVEGQGWFVWSTNDIDITDMGRDRDRETG